MKYDLQYTKQVKKYLNKISEKDSKRIMNKFEFFISQKKPMQFAKKLSGQYSDLYRFRIGNFRAIFHKDNKGNITILTILNISHRKDVY